METKTIEVVDGESKRTVPARAILGGLAVTPWIRKDGTVTDVFQITHINSGLRLPLGGLNYKLRQAQRILAWIVELGGWEKSNVECVADFHGKRKDIYISIVNLEAREGWAR